VGKKGNRKVTTRLRYAAGPYWHIFGGNTAEVVPKQALGIP